MTAKERQMAILNIIKSSKNPIKKKDVFAQLGEFPHFDTYMRDLRVRNPEICKIGDKAGTAYLWKEMAPVRMKNAEGYSDSTAGVAITNIMRKSTTGYPEIQKFGEFWKTAGNNEYEGILVITAKDRMCVGCLVYGARKGFMKDEYVFSWCDEKGRHWVNTINIVNFQIKNITTKLGVLETKEKSDFRKILANTLGYEVMVETKVETKIEEVEKIVEVGMKEDEVQRLLDEQEKEYEKKIAELKSEISNMNEKHAAALAQQKIDIYERILFQKGA